MYVCMYDSIYMSGPFLLFPCFSRAKLTDLEIRVDLM